MVRGANGGGGEGRGRTGAVRGQRSSHPRVTTAHLSVLSKKLNLTFSFRFVLSSPSRMRTETLPRRSTRRVSSPSAVRDGLGGGGDWTGLPLLSSSYTYTRRVHTYGLEGERREVRGERERGSSLGLSILSIHLQRGRGGGRGA